MLSIFLKASDIPHLNVNGKLYFLESVLMFLSISFLLFSIATTIHKKSKQYQLRLSEIRHILHLATLQS